jgi:hypothetical protein
MALVSAGQAWSDGLFGKTRRTFDRLAELSDRCSAPHIAASGKGTTMTFDDLTAEQKDHLFYALNDAREAVRERWLMELGEPIPASVERAIVEHYTEQLTEEQLATAA